MSTIIQLAGNDYEVVKTEGAETQVFVLVHRVVHNRYGGVGLSGPIRRTIKPHSRNWRRAIKLAEVSEALA